MSSKKAGVGGIMLPSWFLAYGTYTDPVIVSLPVLLFSGSTLMGCSAIIVLKSVVVMVSSSSMLSGGTVSSSMREDIIVVFCRDDGLGSQPG